ncbi:MAG: colicin transporter [Parasphingorhabdus sp.]|uniref:colicin transporter n=1 Tax=Parasphingorhabdus sp. TaxID=2709688 RepID=UPI003299BF16
MKLAVKRLEGIGWLALVFLVAILLYPLSLSVATLRSDLTRTDSKIVSVKKEIRYLETEFSARANLRQLEHWNKLEYGYVSPKAAQYLDGERALANLGGKDLRKPVKVAVISTMDKVAPAGIIGSVFPQAAAKAREENSEKTPAVELNADKSEQSGTEPSADQLRETKTARVATMEEKLLDDGLIKQLAARADTERSGRRAP